MAYDPAPSADIIENVVSFFGYAGYDVRDQERTGFVQPDVYAVKEGAGVRQKPHEIYCIVKPDIGQALNGCRDLFCLKAAHGRDPDYALILPNVSEYDLIEWLTGPDIWYYEMKKEAFLLWISDLNRKGVTSLLGYPVYESLTNFFTNPAASGFDSYISQKLNRRFMEEEGF